MNARWSAPKTKMEDIAASYRQTTRGIMEQRKTLLCRLTSHLNGEHGQTLVEYSLVLVLITMVCITVVTLLGDTLINTFYNQIANNMPGG